MEGNVSGSLPGTLTFGNSGAYNDWFHNVTLGGKFGFNIVFGGDFLNTAGNAGTTFGVGLLDATACPTWAMSMATCCSSS